MEHVIEIDVNQGCIDEGKFDECKYCPVAIAMNNAFARFKNFIDAEVYKVDYYLNFEEDFDLGIHPEIHNDNNFNVKNWITRYDNDANFRKNAKPFKFNITIDQVLIPKAA